MSNVKHINQVIERAKQQRADYIGTAVQAYALPAVYRIDIDGTCPVNISRASQTPDGVRIIDCHPGWTAE